MNIIHKNIVLSNSLPGKLTAILQKNKNTFFVILMVLVLSIPAILPLLHNGFFQTDDGEWMVIRFSAFHEVFRDGQIPVRLLSRLNYGYGYPVANFLYPGFMYLAEPFHLAGFNFVNSIKIICILSMLGSAVFTYLWLSKFFDKLSSVIGSLFYLYTPYHLFDLYKRGSIGEIFALAVLPFIVWQIEKRNYFWISLSIALLLISHNTLALLFLPFIFLYTIIREINKTSNCKNFSKYIITISLSFGLSAFFWIPAFSELSITKFSSILVSDYKNYFITSSLAGISSLIVIFIAAFLYIYKLIIIKKNNLQSSIFLLFLIFAVLGIALSSKASIPVWTVIPANYIQFPFRFLSYLLLPIGFLSAFIISSFFNIKKIILTALLIFLLIYSSYTNITPVEYFDKGDTFYSTNEGTTTVGDEYMPKWVKVSPLKHYPKKVEILSGNAEVKDLKVNSRSINFNIESKDISKIRINTIYYPGWSAFINNQVLNIDYTNNYGLMDIIVKSGRYNIKFIYSETIIRLIADIISLISLLILFTVYRKLDRGDDKIRG